MMSGERSAIQEQASRILSSVVYLQICRVIRGEAAHMQLCLKCRKLGSNVSILVLYVVMFFTSARQQAAIMSNRAPSCVGMR